MSYTKRDLVTSALEEIGYAAYIYDLMPEQLDSVLRTLNMMMASWNAIGIRIGYPIASSPANDDLNEIVDINDGALLAISSNLAMKIAPRFGKAIPQELRQTAKQAYDNLFAKLAMPPPMQWPNTMPSGAGNKPWRSPYRVFLPGPVDPLLADNSDQIEF